VRTHSWRSILARRLVSTGTVRSSATLSREGALFPSRWTFVKPAAARNWLVLCSPSRPMRPDGFAMDTSIPSKNKPPKDSGGYFADGSQMLESPAVCGSLRHPAARDIYTVCVGEVSHDFLDGCLPRLVSVHSHTHSLEPGQLVDKPGSPRSGAGRERQHGHVPPVQHLGHHPGIRLALDQESVGAVRQVRKWPVQAGDEAGPLNGVFGAVIDVPHLDAGHPRQTTVDRDPVGGPQFAVFHQLVRERHDVPYRQVGPFLFDVFLEPCPVFTRLRVFGASEPGREIRHLERHLIVPPWPDGQRHPPTQDLKRSEEHTSELH